MSDNTTDTTAALALAEQRARIATAAAGAMLVAGVLLMATILPAEYGVDPLGTGTLLGLTSLAQANETTAEEESAGADGEVPQNLEPVRPGANTAQSVPLKQDTVTFKLGPREGMEYKYRMEKGAGFVYSWTSTGRVNFEFSAEMLNVFNTANFVPDDTANSTTLNNYLVTALTGTNTSRTIQLVSRINW